MIQVARVLLFAVFATALPAQEYQASDREPTPAEVQILEYMNRFRANPQAEFDLIARVDGVDWKMFREEMMALKPAPPLVLNLALLEAARKHSHYMNLNGQFHDEVAGKPGFTGVSPSDRMNKTGYPGKGWAENIFASAESPLNSHHAFIVDWGKGGPGGMQPGRGHRRNMIHPEFRELGAGALPSPRGLSVTHNFSTRGLRMGGGVLFRDTNGNRFYDPGEGVGSVTIESSAGGSCTAWKSGAYAIELKSNDEVTLTATLNGVKYSKTFAAGTDNVKFDVIVPDPAALKKLDKSLSDVERIRDSASAAYFKGAVAVYVNSDALSLDDGRRGRVEDITREIAAPLESAKRAVLAALKDAESPGLKKLLEDQRKPYKGTEADLWFQDAETIARLKRGVAGFQKQAAAASEKDKKQLVSSLEQEGLRLKTTAFKQDLSALIAQAKGL